MALFKNNEDNLHRNSPKTRTFISREMEVTGNFKGKGAVQVEGTLHGDITADSIFITRSGVVNGMIEAYNVIINGVLNGGVRCNTLEIMDNGSVSKNIEATNIKIKGKVEARVIASNLLDITETGSINGDITLGKIIIEEGAEIVGSIAEYKEEKKPEVEEIKATPPPLPKKEEINKKSHPEKDKN
jgi:cytoskeletal protein CcmA (bactofilin family)